MFLGAQKNRLIIYVLVEKINLYYALLAKDLLIHVFYSELNHQMHIEENRFSIAMVYCEATVATTFIFA